MDQAERDSTGRYVMRALAIAGGYYLSGKCGLLLAIAPGYATAVWPASGVALAALLMYGYRMWPAVLLGSALLNSELSYPAQGMQAGLSWLAVAVSIGVGAALQAICGARLVQRFFDVPDPLDHERSVVGFIVLASPLSCLVNATWGTATLLIAGSLQWGAVPFNWFTWWVGDAIGVLIFAPLVLAWFAQPRRTWRERRSALTAGLAIAFSVAVAVFVYSSRWEDQRLRLEFEQHASRITHNLQLNLNGYIETLNSINSLFASSPDVSRQTFRAYVERQYDRHPGIQALEWIPRVLHGERAALEGMAQRDGYLQFQITERTEDGQIIRAKRRDEYFPVFYVEPYAGNEVALGFDLASNPTRLEALNRARDSGEPVATARITLVQETGDQAAFLVFAPVYSGDLAQRNSDWRRNHLNGFALGVFRIGDVVEEVALEDLRATNLEIVVEDLTAGEGLYDSRRGRPSSHQDEVWWRTDISVGGRVWGLSFIPTTAYLEAQPTWYSWLVLVGGLSFTGLIGMVLLMMSGRTTRVARLVEERTTELTQVNDELTTEIGERRRIERELIASKQFAERADRAKSEFLANMSHELRTPLNAIIGYSEMLREEADDSGFDSMSDDLGKVGTSAQHLLVLINDVLDLSKIEAGRMELSPVTFDLFALVDEVVANLRPLMDKNENQLTLDLQGGMRNIHADETKLRQILYNLLSNAAKFTEKGTIRLRTRQLQKEDGEWVEILIGDSGIGMTGEQLERAFDAFSQADASTTRRYGGTGLGLPITRRFSELMGGTIEATSELDKGSTFTVRLPFVPAPPAA